MNERKQKAKDAFDEFLDSLIEKLIDGEHSHTCKPCGVTWSHRNSTMLLDDEPFEEAHTCKQCGKRVVLKDGHEHKK
jgi:hypothetical protein